MRARLCTQRVRTVLGREDSGLAGSNTKGAIGFGAKHRALGMDSP